MSETIETSKKSLVILALSQPGGSERSNPDLAKEIGCDAKFVRSVRAEIETEVLRAEVEKLRNDNHFLRTEHAKYVDMFDSLPAACQTKAAQEPAEIAAPTPVAKPRKRKPHVEHYPLFETV